MKHLSRIGVSAKIKKWLYLNLVVVLVTSIGQGIPARALSTSDCNNLSKTGQGCYLPCNLTENHQEPHYIIHEIGGNELLAVTGKISKHADSVILLDLTQQNNYRQTGVEAYEIRPEAGRGEQESLFRFVRVDFAAFDGASLAQLVFFDFGDRVTTGLGLISINPNGYKVIDVYEVAQGQVVLTSHIEAESIIKEVALHAQQQVNALDNCEVCQFVCNSIVVGGGCGLGGYFACNAICAPVGLALCPVICAVVWGIVCAGGGFFGCNAICNAVGFCL